MGYAFWWVSCLEVTCSKSFSQIPFYNLDRETHCISLPLAECPVERKFQIGSIYQFIRKIYMTVHPGWLFDFMKPKYQAGWMEYMFSSSSTYIFLIIEIFPLFWKIHIIYKWYFSHKKASWSEIKIVFLGGKGVSKFKSIYLYIKYIYIFYSEMKCLYCMSLLPTVENNFGTWLFEGYFSSSHLILNVKIWLPLFYEICSLCRQQTYSR